MQGEAAASDDKAAQAHAILLNDPSFQFDRAYFDPPQAPGWLRWIGETLQFLAPVLKWVFWIGLVLLAGLILYAIVREVLRLRKPVAKPDKPKTLIETEWRPDIQAARDLLSEADALAAQGQYADATHLLLLRSLQDIEKRQPHALRVSLTSREIARLKALPEAARPAFERIGKVVELSLFGDAAVNAQDFADCRQAYEAFALSEGWRA